MNLQSRNSGEGAFSMLEILVSISLLAVVGLAVATSTIRAYVFLKQSMRSSLASQLALDKIEMLATVNPSTLTTANGGTEPSLLQDGVTFSRITTITVNADGSRTASVVVTSLTRTGGRATFTTTFPQWGNT